MKFNTKYHSMYLVEKATIPMSNIKAIPSTYIHQCKDKTKVAVSVAWDYEADLMILLTAAKAAYQGIRWSEVERIAIL